MEKDMAELINLQEADKYLALCRERLVKLGKDFDHSRGKVWSNEQMDQLDQLWEVINALMTTVTSTLHNNRDGRGTPPARGKLNSMMDRSR
jgi:hypothetical protein